MTTHNNATLASQRLALCQKLAEQRDEFSHQVPPVVITDNEFPRSVTMRLLIHRPELSVHLVTQLAALFTGPTSFQAIVIRLVLTRILLSLAAAGKHYKHHTEPHRDPQQFIFR